jgi:UDP-glucose 4-epimerase
MNILVTGGAGFIGSHLAEALVRQGHRVRVLDDFTSGRPENLRPVRGDVQVQEGDCADPRAAAKAVKGVEVVYHEAALPSVARSVAEPLESHRANATGTLTLLEEARRAGVRRFLYAGSSSVYGDTPGLPKRETMETRPLSPYGVGNGLRGPPHRHRRGGRARRPVRRRPRRPGSARRRRARRDPQAA